MIYRQAQQADAEKIALLHADSWRRTYRGLFTDNFLDNEADSERTRTWNARLKDNRPDQLVYIAEDAGILKGFVYVYGKNDDTWGSLIDSLHVSSAFKRQGIGTALMANAFRWLHANFPNTPVYLWVMENNLAARQFYEKLGASNAGMIDKPNPVGGGSARNYRYVWRNVNFVKEHR